MSIRGVLIDFSGTLFRWEISGSWLSDRDDEDRARHLIQVMTAPTGPNTTLPVHMSGEWEQRDLDPVIHRRVYTESLRQAGLTAPGLAEQGYDRLLEPASWAAYPDTQAALERLRDDHIPVAVVSNIAWDIQPIFARAGIADLVGTFVLSFQEGVVKPDAKLFRVACDRLGVDPADTLMIGDSAEADGGAAALGCAVEIIPALPTADRPDALLTALARHGL